MIWWPAIEVRRTCGPLAREAYRLEDNGPGSPNRRT